MHNIKTSLLRTLLGAAVLVPLSIRPSSSWADLTTRPVVAAPNEVETRREVPFGDRAIVITSSTAIDADGNQVNPISNAEVQEIVDLLNEMVNGSPDGTAAADRFAPSPAAAALIQDATTNSTKKLEIRLTNDLAEDPFASTANKNTPEEQGLIRINLRMIKAFIACLDAVVETRVDGRVVAADPKIIALMKRVFLTDLIAHEIKHAGTNLQEVTDANGNVTLQPKPNTTATGNNFRDVKPLPGQQFTSPTDQVPNSPAVEAANAVIEENLGETRASHVRRQFAYAQAGSDDGRGRPQQVYDLDVTAADGTTQTVTLRVQENLSKVARKIVTEDQKKQLEKLQAKTRDNPPEPIIPQRRRDRPGCAASTEPALLDVLEQIPLVTETDTPPSVETGGGLTDGLDTDTEGAGSETDDESTASAGEADTTGATDGETDTTGSSGSDGGGAVTCDPSSAEFSGNVVPQAGVDFDFRSESCATVSGFPPQDQLVLDDFGGGSFGGSGSNLTVLSMEGGTFDNSPPFYFLDNLDLDSPISIEFEADDGTVFSVEFTIVPGEGAGPAQLVNVSVDFGR
ncbi:MAG: hypothetical protein K0V04_32625 [Deltaproteobacteria bacterium]|nr:hypothetical protein [Deltaproteobacteria bacterium]